jgi:hypothetical protein
MSKLTTGGLPESGRKVPTQRLLPRHKNSLPGSPASDFDLKRVVLVNGVRYSCFSSIVQYALPP